VVLFIPLISDNLAQDYVDFAKNIEIYTTRNSISFAIHKILLWKVRKED
jgi:hypothetical protein